MSNAKTSPSVHGLYLEQHEQHNEHKLYKSTEAVPMYLYYGNDHWYMALEELHFGGAALYESSGTDLVSASWTDLTGQVSDDSVRVTKWDKTCNTDNACGSGTCDYKDCTGDGFGLKFKIFFWNITLPSETYHLLSK